ncbi:pentatricopeptide repeat-containing protein At5g66520-like [Prosopis cineraria]|uniref:pentatricopeptide repeat-containing protein At5g66520-like n=1 Tax=Prosopis cineraria TaxID=364024 RepID=UPI00241035F0|nr:pentatricopeptide repeat-containing protein At5g66520-like [Prosopis cineraria]
MGSSQRALLSLLDQCLTLSHIKQIQSLLTVSGNIYDPFIASKVISTCAISDFGDLYHSYRLFRCLPCRNTVIWNSMIRAFEEKGDPATSLSLYTRMLQDGFLPNNYTFSFLLRACTKNSALSMGFMLHDHVIKLGWESYDFVQNGLIHLYASCNIMDPARKLFDLSFNRDVITWTALINGYAKLGQVMAARELFDRMPEKNSVSWSAMINGYVQLGFFKEALELFNDMLASGYRPTPAGIVSALTACASLGALDQGRWIHAYVDRNKMVLDTSLGTALIDMYAKCGSIETARSVFNKMPIRDVFAFTSLISGLANHDESASAVELFDKMQHEGISPNEVTFICVLSACSRMGLVDKGLRIFKSMREHYRIEPWVQHYGCLVDLLGKAGMLEEAKRVVRKMPMEPDSYVLGALLNACRMYGKVELAIEIFMFLNDQNLDHGGVRTLLSNTLASAKQWEDVAKVRTEMQEKKVRKVPGSSSIEINGAVCEFVSGNYSHHFTEDIMAALFEMEKHLKSICLEDDGDGK